MPHALLDPARWSALALSALLAGGAAADRTSERAQAGERVRALPAQGIHLTSWNDSYGSPAARALVTEADAEGFAVVVLVPTWYVDAIDGSSIRPVVGRTPSDDGLRATMRHARARGLRVVLKPHVDCRDDCAWRGHLAPRDRRRFWSHYRSMIERYARLAEAAGATTLVVGTELKGLSGDTEQMRRVIRLARARFDGALTYAANWDEVGQVRFWPQLDAVGVDAYFPLTDHLHPSRADLRRGWEQWLGDLDRVRAGKPVWFTEIGYQARTGTARSPNLVQSPSKRDERAQADAYAVALCVIRDTPWIEGAWWWHWPVQASDDVENAFSARRRPAGRLLRLAMRGTQQCP